MQHKITSWIKGNFLIAAKIDSIFSFLISFCWIHFLETNAFRFLFLSLWKFLKHHFWNHALWGSELWTQIFPAGDETLDSKQLSAYSFLLTNIKSQQKLIIIFIIKIALYIRMHYFKKWKIEPLIFTKTIHLSFVDW